MSKLKKFQKLVIANAKRATGLDTGSKAPDFTLKNALGNTLTLSDILKSKSVILKFYRGEWCPICNLDLRSIQSKIEDINHLGVQLLAISPQNPNDALTMKEKNELQFEVLSDPNQTVIKSYNLQFDPGDDYHIRRDLTVLNGDGSKYLPVPATFIIDQSQTIVYSHIEADYTQRVSPDILIQEIKSLK